jgi:hypothetical protein
MTCQTDRFGVPRAPQFWFQQGFREMAEHKLEFMNAPEENLKTWEHIWKLMVVTGISALVLLLILGAIFV